jgi:hypothetical protein
LCHLARSGTEVMILKLFSLKNLAKIFAFFAQTSARFDQTLVLEKNGIFPSKIAENNFDHCNVYLVLNSFVVKGSLLEIFFQSDQLQHRFRYSRMFLKIVRQPL